jgi:hypothetical protein
MRSPSELAGAASAVTLLPRSFSSRWLTLQIIAKN